MESSWYYLFFGTFLVIAVLFFLRKRVFFGIILLLIGSVGMFYVYTSINPNPFIVAMIMLAGAVIIGVLSKIMQPQMNASMPMMRSLKR